MKRIITTLFAFGLFLNVNITKTNAACTGTCTTCDSLYNIYRCQYTGIPCTGPGSYCSGGGQCLYQGLGCDGKATCSCDTITSTCGCTGGCFPGQVYYSDTCEYSCTPNCSCANNLCSTQTCPNGCGGTCIGRVTYDCSCANNLCSDQTCQGSCGTCTGQLNCPLTTLTTFEIRRASDWSYTDRNDGGKDITDDQNRLHICDPYLSIQASQPRSVIYVAWLSNTLGCDNIDPDSVKMRWLGNSQEISMSKLTDHQNHPHCGYSATVTYLDTVNIPDPATFQITMKSIQGNKVTPWTNVIPALRLKVWDCNLSVTGNFYDSSGQTICSSNAFNDSLPSNLVENLSYYSSSGSAGMSLGANSYNGTIRWGRSYNPVFNNGLYPANPYGSLPVTSHWTRINNSSSCLTGSTITTSQVDPYVTSPSLDVDFSFTRIMEPWYQVVGSGVKTRGTLTSGVPVTASFAYLTRGTSSGGFTEMHVPNNGGVFFNDSFNRNAYYPSTPPYGSPNNWYKQRKLGLASIYDYNYFYNHLYLKQGVGTTGTSWNQRPESGPFFVNGDLTINANNQAFTGQPLLTIVKGNLEIDQNVTTLHGLFVVNGNIGIGGSNTTALNIHGSVYARGDIRASRSLVPKINNNTSPSVIYNYQPSYVLNLPMEVVRVLSGWRME